MKSVRIEDFREAGTLTKIHGTKGEVRFSPDYSFKIKEWVFLLIKGKPVPFFVESVKGTDEAPILKLRYVETAEQADLLVGRTVLVPGKAKRKSPLLNEELNGFTIFDACEKPIGKIIRLVEMPQQLLAEVSYQQQLVLIPVVEDWILHFDKRKKRIDMDLPEGLLPD